MNLYKNKTNSYIHFSDQERVAKGIWLFIPMAIALMINLGVFVTVISVVWKQKKALGQIQRNSKKDDGLMSQYVNLNTFVRYCLHKLSN